MSPPPQRHPASGSRRELPRRLGLWDAVAIYVGIILGSGIFWAPKGVAGAAPGKLTAAALWIVGGVVAACGAFCYAECSGRLPRTGGFYVFYREVYGQRLAFIGGWAALLVTYPASVAAIALIFAQYLQEVAPGLRVPPQYLAVGAILLAGLLNALGVRAGANAQRLLTTLKVLAVAVLCLAALAAPRTAATAAAEPALWSVAGGSAALLAGIVGLLWTYDGWSDVTLVAGEVRHPGRNIGRAVLGGTALLVAVYVLVQLSVQTLLPHELAARSDRVVADAVEAGLGTRAGRLVAALIVISTLGSINGIVLAASRLGFAMARDGTFLSWFGEIHPRWDTPLRSLGVFVVACGAHALWYGTLAHLVGLFSFSVWIFYALTAVALIVLRRRKVGEPPEWRAPGGWLAPLVVLATALYITLGLIGEPETRRAALQGALLLLAGWPVYEIWVRLSRRRRRAAS